MQTGVSKENAPAMQKPSRVLVYLDLLFQHRNKAYGAYELRARYPARLRKAAGGVLFSVGLLSLLPFLMSALSGGKTSNERLPRYDSVILKRIRPDEIKPPVRVEPPKPKPVASQQFTAPKIVANKEVKDEEVLQERDTSRQISSVTSEGERNPFEETQPTGKGTADGAWVEGGDAKLPAEGPHVIVDIQPEFPGDVRAYLASKLQYPDQAREAGIEGRVVIRFVVDEEGGISGAFVQRSVGGGCDEEALRVVRGMPKWKPATVNGKAVKAYFSLPIKFTLEG